jgi:hypothetical protein
VFQLVLNHGDDAQHVFDRSPSTDYETATAPLLSLVQQGYVRVL